MRIRFGPFAFDRQSGLLWRDGAEIALPPRVLGVLALLVDRAGQVVARQDLLDGVWKDAFVTDTSLAEAVSYLRQALGDDPQAPRYIQTVHRRGYRFLAPVVSTDGGLTPDPTVWGLTPGSTVSGLVGARPRADDVEGGKASRLWQFLPFGVALATGAMLATVAWQDTQEPRRDAPAVARFEIQPAPGTEFDRRRPALALSPDGRTIAWSACTRDSGRCALHTRALDHLESTPLAGTDDASSPFFSPDGRWIGFFADGKLKKIATAGGSPSILADAPDPGGAVWGTAGLIAFSGTPAGGLVLVPDQGGPVSPLTTPRTDRGEIRHLNPLWLPSGGIMFTIARTPLADAPGELAAIPARGRDWQTLRAGVTRATVAGPAYLLLSTGTDLQAATFDERSLTLTGGSDSVLATVGGAPIDDFATGGGSLIATAAPAPGTARWSDGADAGSLGRLSAIAIAPDARRAAGVIADGAGSDIWVADLASGALTRMTFSGVNVSPAWSADSRRLFFARRASGLFTIVSRSMDDPADAPVPAAAAAHLFPGSVAADGRIAVTAIAAGRTAVGIVTPSGGLQLLPAAPYDEAAPAFSPDGRWLAVESNESGRAEIVVRDLRDGRRIVASSGGGTHPRWSADGRWIVYDAGRRLMRASFDAERGAAGGAAVVQDGSRGRAIAIAPDGRVALAPLALSPDRAVVVLQWLHELRQRLPLPIPSPR
jgi:DNA-binding winged helix-turn-helix (wHTH) protein/Tol biopolymer transport system component